MELQKINMKKYKNLNKTLVKIDLNCRNDIRIDWNFNGMLLPNIFKRHIFLCDSNSKQWVNYTYQLLKECYPIFKSGDIYTMVTPASTRIQWHEKTKIDKFSLTDFLFTGKYLTNKNKSEWFKKIINKLSAYKEPIFILIMKEPNIQDQKMERILIQLRQKKQVNCLFMICNQTSSQNKIKFQHGICFVGNKKRQIYNFYKHYYQNLACFQAEIILQSLSGNAYMKDNIWKSIQFSIFKRKIYYPLVHNFSDVIETFRLSSQQKKTWKFRFSLIYKLLNGQTYYDRKELQIQIIPEIEKNVTYKVQESYHNKYPLSCEVYLENNPFYRQFALEPGI